MGAVREVVGGVTVMGRMSRGVAGVGADATPA